MADPGHRAVPRALTGELGPALAVFGAAAGGGLWFLLDRAFATGTPDRLHLAAIAFVAAAAAMTLLLAGPLPPRRAAARAVPVAALAAGLLLWASFRFDTAAEFLATGRPVVAWLVLLVAAMPFLLAGAAARDPGALFEASMDLVLRLVAALALTLLLWLLLLVSDSLLNLVGIGVIGRLAAVAAVVWIVSGAAVGLALGAMPDLAALARPLLRGLRLLVPVAATVAVVFLLAVPVRGLAAPSSALLPAIVVLTAALGAVLLVAVAVDRSDAAAAQSPALRLATRILAASVPVLAALAAAAVLLRVRQYGWTPDRLAAAVVAAVLLLTGLGHLAAVPRRGWMEGVRRAQRAGLVAALAVAGLWLTPLLDGEAVSARDQLRRLEAGRTPPEQFDVWPLVAEWGRAGARATARIEAGAVAGSDILVPRIALARRLPHRGSFREAERRGAQDGPIDRLRAALPVVPDEAGWPEDAAGILEPWYVDAVLEGCARTTPAGAPGCVMARLDLVPEAAGPETLILWMDGAAAQAILILSAAPQGAGLRPLVPLDPGPEPGFEPGMIDALRAGRFALEPVPLTALSIAGRRFFALP